MFVLAARYIPPPKDLKGFPNAVRSKAKTVSKGKKLRARWSDDGRILEWDSLHGHVEVYDKLGNHKGGFSPETGQQVSPAVSTRHVER